MHDFSFDPAVPTIGRGETVTFDFAGDVTHTATDSSGLELFDSGNVPQGSGPSLSFTYEAAGVYHFVCTPHEGLAGRASVPMRATPSTGRKHDSFTIVWGPRLQPATTSTTCRSSGRVGVEHVAQRGDDPQESFEPWKTGRARFRARMRDTATGRSSRWSPVWSISVG